jgi:NAD/NADP transhydrogenase alpha subunit
VAELGHETRVAATPATVKQLLGLGYEVVVEKGAGESASFRNGSYAESGALTTDKQLSSSSGRSRQKSDHSEKQIG